MLFSAPLPLMTMAERSLKQINYSLDAMEFAAINAVLQAD